MEDELRVSNLYERYILYLRRIQDIYLPFTHTQVSAIKRRAGKLF